MSTLQCPAKVNLFLAIRAKDASGYHEIETVFARVPTLADEIEIEPAAGFEFHCESLPGRRAARVHGHHFEEMVGQSNSVVQAVRLLEAHTQRTFPYKITLTKNIPPRSGLGGGASDAAAILLYLNEHEKLGLTQEELQALGAQIGMDVSFFLSGHEVALGTHYGEKITPLPALPPDFKISIELTGHEVSTPEAYARWDEFIAQHPDRAAPTDTSLLYNDFELITPECGPYSKTRHLCGSGGAIFNLS
jgi:4-diphosphocytidyl-2-C-methyl-D-erythritol kinase